MKIREHSIKFIAWAVSFAMLLGIMPFTEPPKMLAATAGDFEITGGTGYSYANNTLTITDNGTYTISMRGGVSTTATDYIKVASGVTANITLNGVRIEPPNTTSYNRCAFDMTGATVNLTLKGNNILLSGNARAGLQAPAGSALTVTAESTGTLSATGGQSGAGIGGTGAQSGFMPSSGTITINGGRITATGGKYAAGIGSGSNLGLGGTASTGGNVIINGGTVVAYGGSYAAGIGGAYSPTSAGTLTINGGSVRRTYGETGNATLEAPAKNSNGATVYRVDFQTLPANSKITSFTAYTDNISYYGTNEVYADNDGKISLWFPSGNKEIVIGAGGKYFSWKGDSPNTANLTEVLPQYSVIYDLNGGTGTVPPVTAKPVLTVFKAASLPTDVSPPKYKQFIEWNTASNGGGKSYSEGANITMPAGNIVLYAIWDYATITFDTNGGDAVMPSNARINEDGKLTTLPTPTRTGYTFDGWVPSYAGGTPVTTDTVFTANSTIYAQWSINIYGVNFEVAGGNGTIAAEVDGGGEIISGDTAEHGESVIFKATPDDGYKVKEWTLNGAAVTGETSDTYTLSLTESVSVTVEFEPIEVTGVTLDITEITLKTGDSETLTANITPADALDKSVTWTSGDDGVASVDSDGVVTAVGIGTATITVTTVDGGFTDTCTVTVNEKIIESADISVTIPTIGATPNVTATGAGNFTIGAVAWSPSDTSFIGGTIYTATVTLTANANYTFTGTTNLKINGQAALVTNNTGTAVTLSFEFPHIHDWAATLESDGTNHWKKCTVPACTEVNGKAEHSYNNWITDTAATYTKGGTRHRNCSVCNYRQNGTTSPLPDNTAPTGEITIKSKGGFTSFIEKITFGLFFKNTAEVTVTSDDTGSGVKTVEYLKSDTVCTEAEVKALTGWTAYTGKFNITSNWKGCIYVRITDVAGNVTIICSNGIVVYVDSVSSTAGIDHTKLSGDESIAVTLNGNTVADIKNGLTALILDTDYTVDNSTGIITLKSAYLDSLAAGEYTLTVSFNPMGEIFVNGGVEDNDAPATTTVSLTIKKTNQSAPKAPSFENKTETSITLNEIEGAEYRIGNGTWQSSTEFTGLQPNSTYVFYARMGGTDIYNASPVSSATVIVTVENAEGLHISSVNVTENGGWLEITNSTENAISTKGLFLSNNDNADKWAMPAVIIRPGMTVRICANSNSTDEVLKRLLTNFDMEVGETIRLTGVFDNAVFEVEISE